MTTAQIKLPKKIAKLFKLKRGDLRIRGAFGGRGSGKSQGFATIACVWGYSEPLRFLCLREFQNSIPESFYAELKKVIEAHDWMQSFYTITNESIKGANGTEFIFKGLRNNLSSIKSIAKIDVCIIEEAEDISDAAWEVLEPTIRAPKSEIWVIWNPKHKGSATDKRFRIDAPPRSCVVEMNYGDNPFFPAELDEQRLHQQKTLDHSKYAWIWQGAYYELSEAQVFRGNYRIESFEVDSSFNGAYYGLDFGFANDPTAGVECYIKDNVLYIRRECGKTGLELDATADHVLRHMPNAAKCIVRADSARPESISYLRRHGLQKIVGVKKGKGSVEDGVEFIKSFDAVIIHSDCKNVADEFRLYSYKTDRLSGDILPILIDANNHWIDALRYALEPIMRNKFNKDKFGAVL